MGDDDQRSWYETPDAIPPETTFLVLPVPASREIIGLVLGAFMETLLQPDNYIETGVSAGDLIDALDESIKGYQVLDEIFTEGAMLGEVRMWASNTIPDGWRKCDGSSLSRTTYADLFAVIGTIWGSTDASSFSLPNLEDRAPTGANSLSGHAAGTAYGAATHTLSDNEISHRHSLSRGNNGAGANNVLVTTGAVANATFTDYVGSGTRVAHNNIPPSLAIHFIIYVGEGE